ncbi:MAG: PP2C family protein-serine/threonine phosphatase [Ignavibacteria bacterium]
MNNLDTKHTLDTIESFDDYLLLPREQAYKLLIDQKNLKIFRVVLNIFIIISLIICIINFAIQEYLNISLIISLINLSVLIVTRLLYKKYFGIKNISRSIFAFLIIQMLIFISIEIFYPNEDNNDIPEGKKSGEELKKELADEDIKVTVSGDEDDTFLSYLIFIGIMVLIFRFSRSEIIQLFLIALLVPILLTIIFQKPFQAGEQFANLLTGSILFFSAFIAERKRQKNFNGQYDFYYKKNYENLRMKKELNYAREIQLSMLPENEAVIGDIKISGVSNPASEVGGDYFDYFKISNTETGFFICDVSGHGVASGLLLSGLRSCMHLILEDHSNPKVIMEKLNRMIRKTQNRKMFVTAIIAIIDSKNNKCRLFNAGHLPPYKISGESGEIFKIKKHGIALGAMNTVDINDSDNEVVIDFKKDDKIIFYTDGVNEAMKSNNTEYGLDNLELYLNNNSTLDSEKMLKGLLGDVRKFTGDSVQRDDLTLLIIQRI